MSGGGLRTILVTGGAGFIGGHVVRKLAERGDRVVLFDAGEPRGETAWLLRPVIERVTCVAGNVDSWAEVMASAKAHRPDAIVHTAAIGDPAAVHRRPHLALRVNVEGTLNVLEAARLFDVKRVVVFSSIGALPGIRYQPVDAAHPVILPDEGPGSGFYGASKVACEAFCFGHRQAFGTDFIVLRPSAVYGFSMRHPIFIKPMVEDAVRGGKTRFASGREFPRDYTHVQDVAQLTLRALDAPVQAVRDRILYAATGQPLRTAGEVAQIVRRAVPGADIDIGPGLSETDRLEIRYRGVLSIDSARKQLGYEPRYAALEDGVAEYVSTYRQYLQEQQGPPA
jgi:nucleoside-diphosphate-sugar epimerase